MVLQFSSSTVFEVINKTFLVGSAAQNKAKTAFPSFNVHTAVVTSQESFIITK